MLHIPEALRHYIEYQDFSLGEPKRIHNTFPDQLVNVKETKYGIYPRSTQALHRMPGLQPGWTKKDTQHFPILTMNEKLSMLYIPEALRHLMLNARTAAWINQKGYTTFPYINHYIYPKSTQALCWMPGLQPGWTRKDTQHFPLLTMNEKLSMLHIPEVLRHCIECQDFSLD